MHVTQYHQIASPYRVDPSRGSRVRPCLRDWELGFECGNLLLIGEEFFGEFMASFLGERESFCSHVENDCYPLCVWN